LVEWRSVKKKYEQIDMLIDVMLILSLIKWEMSIESTLDVCERERERNRYDWREGKLCHQNLFFLVTKKICFFSPVDGIFNCVLKIYIFSS
jgi:hypothetical protein